MPTDVLLSVALLICPLIGGVVTFGLQLHGLRRAQLEFERAKLELNSLQSRLELDQQSREKLLLEVDELRGRLQERSNASPFIHKLSTEDVLKYSDIRFSEREAARETHDRPKLDRLKRRRPDFEHTGAMPQTEEEEEGEEGGDTLPLAPIDSEGGADGSQFSPRIWPWRSFSLALAAIYMLLVIAHFIRSAA